MSRFLGLFGEVLTVAHLHGTSQNRTQNQMLGDEFFHPSRRRLFLLFSARLQSPRPPTPALARTSERTPMVNFRVLCQPG